MSLGRQAAKGLFWLFGQTFLARGTGFVSQIILAGLLSPADFGLIGLTYGITTVAAVFTNIGLQDVVIQRARHMRHWTGPAFWLSFGLGLATCAAVCAAAPVAAWGYRTPALTGLIWVVAFSMPVGALSVVPELLFRARMNFRFLAVYGTAETIGQAIATVVLAALHFGAYSFVIPVPAAALVRTLVYWHQAPVRIGLRPQVRRWRYLTGSTSKVFLTNLLLTLIAQGDYIVLGFFGTQAAVGAYYFGYRLAAQPLWTLAGNLANVLFPVFVQLKDDPVRQGRAALDASSLLATCVIGLACVQASVAAPVMLLLFGTKWLAAIPVVQLLSVGLAIDAVSWISGSLLKSRGEYTLFFLSSLAAAPLFFVLILLGAWRGGIVGVAAGVFLFYAISQPCVVYAAYRRVGLGAREVGMIFIRPLACGGLACLGALGISALLGLAARPLAETFVRGSAVALIYAACLRIAAPAQWRAYAGQLGGLLRRRVPAVTTAV